MKFYNHFFLLFLSLSTHLCFAKEKIVVIGAGFAGLTTAYRLQQQGFDVQVYEARNRVGGRVFTIQIDDSIAEMGGLNILDGGDAPNLIGIIKDLGLETEQASRQISLKYFDESGITDVREHHPASSPSPEKLMEQLQQAASASRNMEEVLDRLFSKDEILYKVSKVHLSGYEGAPTNKLSTFYIKTLFHMLQGGLSSLHNVDEASQIQFLYVKGGNVLIAEELAKKLEGRVHKNLPLKSIAKNQSGSYLLTFKNGEKVTTNIVVLAIPCSTYENIEFDENVIAQDKLTLIQSVQYGTNSRILTPVSESNTQINPFTNGRVVSFFNRDDKILTNHFIDDFGDFTAKTLPNIFENNLDMWSKGYLLSTSSKKLVLAEDRSFALYNSSVGHNWPKDPYSKGTYSCIGAGKEETFVHVETFGDEMVKSLFKPIDNTLFFAGEHATINIDAGGTMEAAVESGERTARMIMAKYGH